MAAPSDDTQTAAVNKTEGRRILKALSDRLAAAGYTHEDVGAISRVGGHETAMKLRREDGTDVVHTAQQFNWKLDPAWLDGPAWPVVQPAAPVRIARRKGRPSANGTHRIAIFPDQQFGFRNLDGDLIPIHDPAACSAALEVAAAAKVDAIVNLGDALDLNEWSSKFIILPEFQGTTQPALDALHEHLCQQRAIAEHVRILEGNHDDRLAVAIANNARAAMRLRPAMSTPESWPLLSLPRALRLDEIDVEWVDGYPANRTRIASGAGVQTPLWAIHGEHVDVVRTAKQARQSYLMGHIHRKATHAETFEVDGEPIVVEVISDGCLCRIDGMVPSTKSSKTRRMPVTRFESWQQGLGVIEVYDDGTWAHEHVPIHRGQALWRGRRYGD